MQQMWSAKVCGGVQGEIKAANKDVPGVQGATQPVPAKQRLPLQGAKD